MAFKSDPGQCSCGNICNRLEKRGLFLGTDGAASLRVGQMLLFRVEGPIPYNASLNVK